MIERSRLRRAELARKLLATDDDISSPVRKRTSNDDLAVHESNNFDYQPHDIDDDSQSKRFCLQPADDSKQVDSSRKALNPLDDYKINVENQCPESTMVEHDGAGQENAPSRRGRMAALAEKLNSFEDDLGHHRKPTTSPATGSLSKESSESKHQSKRTAPQPPALPLAPSKNVAAPPKPPRLGDDCIQEVETRSTELSGGGGGVKRMYFEALADEDYSSSCRDLIPQDNKNGDSKLKTSKISSVTLVLGTAPTPPPLLPLPSSGGGGREKQKGITVSEEMVTISFNPSPNCCTATVLPVNKTSAVRAAGSSNQTPSRYGGYSATKAVAATSTSSKSIANIHIPASAAMSTNPCDESILEPTKQPVSARLAAWQTKTTAGSDTATPVQARVKTFERKAAGGGVGASGKKSGGGAYLSPKGSKVGYLVTTPSTQTRARPAPVTASAQRPTNTTTSTNRNLTRYTSSPRLNAGSTTPILSSTTEPLIPSPTKTAAPTTQRLQEQLIRAVERTTNDVVDRDRKNRVEELASLERRWKGDGGVGAGGMDEADESADERCERYRAVSAARGGGEAARRRSSSAPPRPPPLPPVPPPGDVALRTPGRTSSGGARDDSTLPTSAGFKSGGRKEKAREIARADFEAKLRLMGFDVRSSDGSTTPLTLPSTPSAPLPPPLASTLQGVTLTNRPFSSTRQTPGGIEVEDKKITTTTFSDQERVTITKKKVFALGETFEGTPGGRVGGIPGVNIGGHINLPSSSSAVGGGGGDRVGVGSTLGGGSIYNLIKKQMHGTTATPSTSSNTKAPSSSSRAVQSSGDDSFDDTIDAADSEGEEDDRDCFKKPMGVGECAGRGPRRVSFCTTVEERFMSSEQSESTIDDSETGGEETASTTEDVDDEDASPDGRIERGGPTREARPATRTRNKNRPLQTSSKSPSSSEGEEGEGIVTGDIDELLDEALMGEETENSGESREGVREEEEVATTAVATIEQNQLPPKGVVMRKRSSRKASAKLTGADGYISIQEYRLSQQRAKMSRATAPAAQPISTATSGRYDDNSDNIYSTVNKSGASATRRNGTEEYRPSPSGGRRGGEGGTGSPMHRGVGGSRRAAGGGVGVNSSSQDNTPLPLQSDKPVKQRIQELQEQINIELSIIQQTSNALNQCCHANSAFAGSAEAVECHRLLLISCKKREAYVIEMQKMRERGGGKVGGQRGRLTISDIRLPLKSDFVSKLGTAQDISTHYFIVMIRHDCHVVFTQMCSTHDAAVRATGSIDLPNLINLNDINENFVLDIEVYGMSVTRNDELSSPHSKKKGGSGGAGGGGGTLGRKFLTPGKGGSTTRRRYESPGGPTAVRTTSFSYIASLSLTAAHLLKTHFSLEKMPFSCPLHGSMTLRLKCLMESRVEERGFLSMFEDVSGFGAWHRRWFVLKDNRLSYWKYPDEERDKEAMGVIDLKLCITDVVGLIARDVCARPNSFELCTIRKPTRGDRETLTTKVYDQCTTTKHWFSADTKEERLLWCDRLNEMLISLRAWHADALRPAKKHTAAAAATGPQSTSRSTTAC